MKAVPGALTIYRRLRNGWRRVRPYPRPRYLANTPKRGTDDPFDIFCPPTALSLGEAAMSDEAARHVLETVGRLSPSSDRTALEVYYAYSRRKYGKFWRHADLLRMLYATATFLEPQTYLEIGVWRGRSAAVLGAIAPECAIYGFDMWIEDYHGVPSPGPDFVREELKRAGHYGPVTLVSGDSARTLPRFLREHPGLFFDVISIDGTKTVDGCGADFANALPRLKIGGVLIFDDLPVAPWLDRIWTDLIRHDPRYTSWDFNDAGFGVAAAVRFYQ